MTKTLKIYRLDSLGIPTRAIADMQVESGRDAMQRMLPWMQIGDCTVLVENKLDGFTAVRVENMHGDRMPIMGIIE
jgi:hypothetical protein